MRSAHTQTHRLKHGWALHVLMAKGKDVFANFQIAAWCPPPSTMLEQWVGYQRGLKSLWRSSQAVAVPEEGRGAPSNPLWWLQQSWQLYALIWHLWEAWHSSHCFSLSQCCNQMTWAGNKWRALKRKERPWWKSKKLLNDRFKAEQEAAAACAREVQGKKCVFAEPLCPAFPSHKNKNMLMHRYTPLPRFLHTARKPVLPLAPKIIWALPGKGFELQAYFLTTWLWALMKKKICQIPNDDFLKIACIWWHFWWVCSV